MSEADSNDSEEPGRVSAFIKSLGTIPCLRRSFLTGISSGMGIGVGYFMCTSNVRRATHVGFGSYMLITTGTWFYCRYHMAKERIKLRELKKALQQKVASDGTTDFKDV